MRKKVLVTGGCGFIGHNLVLKLAESCEVAVVDNLAGGYDRPRVEGADYRRFDIADQKNAEELEKACEGVSYVFHLAALPRVQDSIERPVETARVNVLGTIAVLNAAKKAGVTRVVFASSSAVYGDYKTIDGKMMSLCESMEPRPMSPYARHKYMGEQLCGDFSDQFDLQTVCLRFFNVYGPWADPNGAYASVVAKFLEQKRRGDPLTIVSPGTQTRDFVHVDDAVRAMCMAAQDKKEYWGHAINIGGGKSVSVKKLAELIGGPTKEIEPRQEPQDSLASIWKAKGTLGWEPKIPLEEGMRRLVESTAS
jgi:UDP-glucose 4-epimerase